MLEITWIEQSSPSNGRKQTQLFNKTFQLIKGVNIPPISILVEGFPHCITAIEKTNYNITKISLNVL